MFLSVFMSILQGVNGFSEAFCERRSIFISIVKYLMLQILRKMSVVSLNTHLDMSGSECLNMSDDHPLSNCLQDDAAMLKSDCDEQLIISLAFNQVFSI